MSINANLFSWVSEYFVWANECWKAALRKSGDGDDANVIFGALRI